MIEAKNLSFSYGTEKVLGPIDLHIQPHTSCAIIGGSGCGKTTLLLLLAGLLKNTEGSLSIENTPLVGVRPNTGVILQNLGLLPWKTVYDNVALGLINTSLSPSLRKEKVLALLEQLGLALHGAKYPHELSGGQKQRVAIARTLIQNPDVLLLDEATSSLDDMSREQLQKLILKMYKAQPTTLVFVTHSIEEAVFLGQHIIIMDKGLIIEQIDNPFFGNAEAREDLEFYQKCLEVRTALRQEAIL